MKKLCLILPALILLSLSCSRFGKQQSYETAAAPQALMKESAAGSGKAEARSDDPPAAVIDRKLIREGSIAFRTKDITETKTKLDAIVKETGSYYGNETQTSGKESLEVTCTVSIPAEKFDAFLEMLTRFTGELESKKIDTLDVTEEYMDLEVRINNKKQLEETFRQLLPKAKSIDEILAVEAQIANVREEVERSEGRLRFLQKSVNYSTLTITYRQQIPARAEYGFNLKKAFLGGWNFFVTLCIALVYFWPLAALFLFLALVAAVIYRIRKNRNY